MALIGLQRGTRRRGVKNKAERNLSDNFLILFNSNYVFKMSNAKNMWKAK